LKQELSHIAIVVNDYDEAIRFYCDKLHFTLLEDTILSETKRWVKVKPPGSSTGASLLLAKASNDEQASRIGNQTGGRVFLFLHTDNFERDFNNLLEQNITIIRQPSVESYGIVAVFSDIYGKPLGFNSTQFISMHKKIIILAIGFFFVINSCGKDDNGSNQPPATPIDAPISGQVMLFDEGVAELDKSGMTVTVDSTSPPQKAVTGSDGKFFIPYIGFGKRILIFEKSGYGTFKLVNVAHNYNNGLGTVVPAPALGKISTTTITVLTTSVSAVSVAINVTTSPAGNINVPKYVRLFLHTRAGVSNTLIRKLWTLS
jgi:catechol 2,3-dioxygenase-like lactoylglutathione lyase family enzyme